ncbi:hypothetical protein SAMN05421877_10461 [Sphingobacterium lactis]|uniref:Uncharacterized protein n=1 Tax=Sphingobacterium lactis TaxID=797291 RepID=A0A1H5WJV5_9SPHI|nr:hypothetical protein SAMN05421877_10461 [Sphingobacterium lactis]
MLLGKRSLSFYWETKVQIKIIHLIKFFKYLPQGRSKEIHPMHFDQGNNLNHNRALDLKKKIPIVNYRNFPCALLIKRFIS